ncbi:uncharacterized protein LOC116158643 [Photinus pyralis]|uniref:uncharacterized protein LOC116158643 n=1 Tax=Photinus pyralis TaxID=7054 RepID=UPI00126709C9|nr:uncharacterized protein LOC116158643 [Photinus pyralis]
MCTCYFSNIWLIDMEDATLIELVEQFEVLYNRRHKDFKNKLVRENAWKSIAAIFNDTPENVENRWNSLRNRYAAELRKTKTIPSGSGAQTVWIHMSAMNFINAHIVPRRSTVSNVKATCSGTISGTETGPSCSRASNVWDTMSVLTEKSEDEGAESGVSESSVYSTQDDPPADELATQVTEPVAVSHKRKAGQLRQRVSKKVHSDVDDILVETIQKANVILDTQKSEEELFCESLAKSLQQIQCPRKKMRAKIEIMQVVEQYL